MTLCASHDHAGGRMAPAHSHHADPALTDAFRHAMGRLAGAVSVITAGHGSEARGLTATAVCSVSMAPPTLLVCVNRNGEAHRTIAEAGAFCVNVLAEHDRPIADRFAGRHGHAGASKFGDGEWLSLATGAPALGDALVSIDCSIAECVDAYTHTVFFGTVRAVRLGAAAPPLVHFDRAYRTLA
ncbi:flavin reductase (DIM6/NTAB) family NADH-FMN oxidoreductase RutF [Angulomicrobium tetraedrale]|uniref:Flavin reductase (DIM6/NTAB) family NADH-FMN oxidoreductase RutF n=1 Tax=Ancylobacter tetraedralis TaxID=217068 RepID=A0A839ZCR9_9HYPH|nr:flavin reductase [Ancylobacter tetraedralis]MBB3772583.1 flavin reductase (DIM6/NTAB) family NADH-FMN oxidoreductase RutF [Ancylobacter tetraedralis]